MIEYEYWFVDYWYFKSSVSYRDLREHGPIPNNWSYLLILTPLNWECD